MEREESEKKIEINEKSFRKLKIVYFLSVPESEP